MSSIIAQIREHLKLFTLAESIASDKERPLEFVDNPSPDGKSYRFWIRPGKMFKNLLEFNVSKTTGKITLIVEPDKVQQEVINRLIEEYRFSTSMQTIEGYFSKSTGKMTSTKTVISRYLFYLNKPEDVYTIMIQYGDLIGW